MNNIVLSDNDLRILRYIIEFNSNLGYKIKKRTIPITMQDVIEFCIKIGADHKSLNFYA